MLGRRTLLGTLGTVGLMSLSGCSASQNGSSTAGSSSPAELVEAYYTAAANGDLEGMASRLAMTQFGEEGQSVEQLTNTLQDRGMSEDGTDVSLGTFNELSVSEFAAFSFRTEDGEQRQFTEQEAVELLPKASAFGGDEEQVTLVHHTGGYLPEIWVPYQPTEEPTDGWGEVIIEVGSYGGEPFIIGDFRTYTDYKVIEN